MLQFYTSIFIFAYYSQLCFAQSATSDQAAQNLIAQMTSQIALVNQTKTATLFYTGNDTSTRFFNAEDEVASITAMGKIMMPNNQVALAAGKQDKFYLFQMDHDSNGGLNKMICLNHRSSRMVIHSGSGATRTASNIYPIQVGSNMAGPVFVIGINDSGVIQCLSESVGLSPTGAPLMQDISVGCVQFNALATQYVG